VTGPIGLTDAVLGVRLVYWFPGGPAITVLLTELFTDEMQDVLRFYRMQYGLPRIFQPFPTIPNERRRSA
jgi:hypothetical protein